MNQLITIKKILTNYLNESIEDYSKWKRNNVTYRGIKEFGKPNEVYGSLGNGLYTVPLSNKAMAKQYGDLYYVVNAKPTKPKIVNGLNNAELLIQNLIDNFCKENGQGYSRSFFEQNTTIEKEMLKLGYNGIIIKGREMVNYEPINIRYFKTETELINYYNSIKKIES
jgi:hypothetical protein